MEKSKPQLSFEYFEQVITSSPPLTASELISKFSYLEPTADGQHDTSNTDLISTFYTLYFLSLILDDDLTEARFLSKRVNQNIFTNDAALICCYTILRSLWSRNYPVFYQTMTNAPWNSTVAPLATRVLDHRRQKMINLLSIAYTSIPPNRASIYLGSDNDQSIIQELVDIHHWNYDQPLNLLIPKKNGGGELVGRVKDRDGDIGGIAKLAGMVGRLSDL